MRWLNCGVIATSPGRVTERCVFGQDMSERPAPHLHVLYRASMGWPTAREGHGHRVPVVVRAQES